MPHDFETVAGYWEELKRWLNVDKRGDFGICTATRGGYHWLINYPISQCLLRKADRARLPDFFEFAGVAPKAEIDPDDLVGPLERWCQRSTCGLSSRAKDLFIHGSNEVRQQITQIVAEEARLWGGEIEDATGRRIAPIILQIEPARGGHEFNLQFFPRRPQGFPAGTFRSTHGSFRLVPLEGSEWYEPIPLDPQRVLDQGVELRDGNFTLRWTPTALIVAKQDMELGGYSSRPQASLNEPLIVLCRSYLQRELEQFLGRYAAPGWRPAPGTWGLPRDWQAYLDVTIRARAPWARPEFASLLPDQRVSISLEAGLKLDSTTWLAGGEPTLRVSLGHSGPLDISVDGKLISQSSDGTAQLDLSTLGLNPGTHVVAVSGRTRRFETCRSGDYQSPVVPSGRRHYLGHVLLRKGNRFGATYPAPRTVEDAAPPAGELRVVGAAIIAQPDDLPENLPGPIILPGGARRHILLGPQPGMVYECRDPNLPPFAWFGRRAVALPFEVAPPFQPTWVVRVSWGRHTSLRPIGRPTPPSSEPWPGGDVQAWARWVRKKHRRGPKGEAANVWQRYVRVARAL